MLRFFVIAASAAAFGALPASANASSPFGMPGAQTHRIEQWRKCVAKYAAKAFVACNASIRTMMTT